MNKLEKAVIDAALLHDDAIRLVRSAETSICGVLSRNDAPSTAMMAVLDIAEEDHDVADRQLDAACEALKLYRAEGANLPSVFFEWAFWAVAVVAAGALAAVLTY